MSRRIGFVVPTLVAEGLKSKVVGYKLQVEVLSKFEHEIAKAPSLESDRKGLLIRVTKLADLRDSLTILLKKLLRVGRD